MEKYNISFNDYHQNESKYFILHKNINLIIIILVYLWFLVSKRKRRKPKQLQNFVLLASTVADNESNQILNSVEFHFRVNSYFKILDSVIMNMEQRFSPESLKMAVAVDNFFKLNFEDSKFFVYHYQVIII